MNARYGTLALDVEGKVGAVNLRVKNRFVAKLVGAAVFLVAAAACVATVARTSSGKVASAANLEKEFMALDSAPVNCDKMDSNYVFELPRYDPNYSATSDFYNACYYSFRCCTTTGNGNGCYVSGNFGPECRSCIKHNSPRFVKETCEDWLGDDFSDEAKDDDWGKEDLVNDNGVPQTAIPKYDLAFSKLPGSPTSTNPQDRRSCWQPRGMGDEEVGEYSEKCFEVLSWCNELCPRDTIETEDHVMCKHCFLVGFQDKFWNKDHFDKQILAGREDAPAP